MRDLKYADLLRLNRELKTHFTGHPYRAAVLSNVTVHQIKEIFEYALRSQGINIDVELGDYDNILQNSVNLGQRDLYVIFWELAYLTEGFHYRAEAMEEQAVQSLVDSMKKSIASLFVNLKNAPLIIMNKFSALPFSHSDLRFTVYDAVAQTLNDYLKTETPRNCVLVDLDKIYAGISLAQSLDWRTFYSSQALYSINFLKAYAASIAPLPLSIQGKNKKALIFDCDNTLWKGIVGEDGPEALQFLPPFQEVQHLALSLAKRGIIIGLCSKNEPQDVESVLRHHPGMILKESDIVIKKLNWADKPGNIEAIARELNIGLDSLVMVEDSDFEVNLLRQHLPQLTVIQVPKNISEYPTLLRDASELFYAVSHSQEDTYRGRMYKQEEQRKEIRQSFQNVDDFLRSLRLRVTVHCDDPALISRLAQLTQKTNQFNLTTRRYTEVDIAEFTRSRAFEVLALEISDIFGQYGVAGFCLLKLGPSLDEAEIDTWLLSCRVLGRSIEMAFVDFLVDRLGHRQIRNLRAMFRRTEKNGQVESFYDGLGFSLVEEAAGSKKYTLSLADYHRSRIDYVDVQASEATFKEI